MLEIKILKGNRNRWQRRTPLGYPYLYYLTPKIYTPICGFRARGYVGAPITRSLSPENKRKRGPKGETAEIVLTQNVAIYQLVWSSPRILNFFIWARGPLIPTLTHAVLISGTVHPSYGGSWWLHVRVNDAVEMLVIVYSGLGLGELCESW